MYIHKNIRCHVGDKISKFTTTAERLSVRVLAPSPTPLSLSPVASGILLIPLDCPVVGSEVGECCIVSTVIRLHRLFTSCPDREREEGVFSILYIPVRQHKCSGQAINKLRGRLRSGMLKGRVRIIKLTAQRRTFFSTKTTTPIRMYRSVNQTTLKHQS